MSAYHNGGSPGGVIDVAVREHVRGRRTSTDVNSRKFVGDRKNGAWGPTLGGDEGGRIALRVNNAPV